MARMKDNPLAVTNEVRAGSAAGLRGGCLLGYALAATALSLAYMVFEAQWVRCRQADLPVPGLPHPWSGLTILHLSDIHAGEFLTNRRSLAKAVRWAKKLTPDLVLLTGDILGDTERSEPYLKLLAELRPSLGAFAVTGNHEYGLGKAPLAEPRDATDLWTKAGITLLTDQCVTLPTRNGHRINLCGADYISGGYGLLEDGAIPPGFSILLIHDPPGAGSPLAARFPLGFAGHTHGGQLRVPSPSGLIPLHMKGDEYLGGIHRWGLGQLVVSNGIGTSFLPLRLLTRPEATLWRLVYTSCEHPAQADESK